MCTSIILLFSITDKIRQLLLKEGKIDILRDKKIKPIHLPYFFSKSG
jgi:hypothetical protein